MYNILLIIRQSSTNLTVKWKTKLTNIMLTLYIKYYMYVLIIRFLYSK